MFNIFRLLFFFQLRRFGRDLGTVKVKEIKNNLEDIVNELEGVDCVVRELCESTDLPLTRIR